MHYRVVLLILMVTATTNLNTYASKEIKALLTREAIEIDGSLNEEDWSRAQVIEDFMQQYPDEGQPLSERTEVRLLYDREKLYIGFECYDSEPEKIVANEMRRDGQLWQNDNVYIMLDTYGDKRQCFFFRRMHSVRCQTLPSQMVAKTSTGVGTVSGKLPDDNTKKGGQLRSRFLLISCGLRKKSQWRGV